MQVVLIMFRNGGERRSFSVVRSTTTIGRREDCDLRIPVGDVSRKHCRLVLAADSVRLQDLGSSNGTFVNGQREQDVFLNAGDTVGVGPVQFVVQIDGIPAEEDIATPAPAGESALGGTALAADALVARQSAEPDLVAEPDLLEEIVDEPAAAAAAPEEVTLDELVPEPAAQDVAFDLATDAEPAAAEHVEHTDHPGHAAAAEPDAVEPPAAAAPAEEAGDWDFLIEEPEAGRSNADMHVNLDSSHGHPHN